MGTFGGGTLVGVTPHYDDKVEKKESEIWRVFFDTGNVSGGVVAVEAANHVGVIMAYARSQGKGFSAGNRAKPFFRWGGSIPRTGRQASLFLPVSPG